MNKTLTISLTPQLAEWLAQTAEKTARTEEKVAQQQLEEARIAMKMRPWLAYAGCVEGPEDLSMREGFGPR